MLWDERVLCRSLCYWEVALAFANILSLFFFIVGQYGPNVPLYRAISQVQLYFNICCQNLSYCRKNLLSWHRVWTSIDHKVQALAVPSLIAYEITVFRLNVSNATYVSPIGYTKFQLKGIIWKFCFPRNFTHIVGDKDLDKDIQRIKLVAAECNVRYQFLFIRN